MDRFKCLDFRLHSMIDSLIFGIVILDAVEFSLTLTFFFSVAFTASLRARLLPQAQSNNDIHRYCFYSSNSMRAERDDEENKKKNSIQTEQ